MYFSNIRILLKIPKNKNILLKSFSFQINFQKKKASQISFQKFFWKCCFDEKHADKIKFCKKKTIFQHLTIMSHKIMIFTKNSKNVLTMYSYSMLINCWRYKKYFLNYNVIHK